MVSVVRSHTVWAKGAVPVPAFEEEGEGREGWSLLTMTKLLFT